MTEEQKKIILVDDNDANLTACKKILKPYYAVYPVLSAEKMFDLLEHITPDLILLDVEMPDMNGYDAARTLKNTEE
jgi:putative two-component system response regulator